MFIEIEKIKNDLKNGKKLKQTIFFFCIFYALLYIISYLHSKNLNFEDRKKNIRDTYDLKGIDREIFF